MWSLSDIPPTVRSAIHRTGATVRESQADPQVELVRVQQTALAYARMRDVDADPPRHLARSFVDELTCHDDLHRDDIDAGSDDGQCYGAAGWSKSMHNVLMTDLSVLGPPQTAGAPTLVEGIQLALREAITHGELPAGYRLREIPLAEHFGCSTTPVREALRRLEHEGLVKVHPRRGAEVMSVTTAEIAHLYEMRIIVESYAVRKAAERKPGKAELAMVRRILEKQKQMIAADDERQRLDADFHCELTALGGNPVIAEWVERTVRQIEAVQARFHAVVQGDLDRTYRAHASILSAVSNGEPDRAEKLTRDHLELVRQVVTSAIEEHTPAGTTGA